MATDGLVAETYEIKKYYFVCYQDYMDHFQQKVLDLHPLQWQRDEDKIYGAAHDVKVISWQELSKEEYELYKYQI